MGKKIVHVINDFPSKSETFIVNHIVETIKNGYEVTILVNNLNPISTSSQVQLLNKYRLYHLAQICNPKLPHNKFLRIAKALHLLIKNIGSAQVFFKTLNRKYGKKSRTLKMWYQAAEFLNYKNADIVHGHFGVSGRLIAEMKAIGAISSKVFTTFYGIDTFSTEVNRKTLKDEYSLVFQYSDRIITSSNYLANNLALLNTSKTRIIINSVGVDVEKFKYQKRLVTSSLKLVTVGRLIKLKGQHLGIKAVKILVDKGYNIHYTIVGDGQCLLELKALISDLELKPYITLKQSKTQNEVLETLYDSHLFLMTSTMDHLGRAEGQGLVTAEAQSTGIPAIGFNCGGVPETITHKETGIIVGDTNENSLANSIELFIANPNLIAEMGKKASVMVDKDFNNHIQSKKIIDLYNIN